jgi:hypothetical protein
METSPQLAFAARGSPANSFAQKLNACHWRRICLISKYFMLKKISTQLLCGLAVAEAAAQTRSFFNTQH